MSVLSKFNYAVDDAVKKGIVDRVRQGPIISAGRKIAKMMDDPDWPIIHGKIDNVGPSVFLKYCETLGLTIGKKDAEKEKKTGDVVKLVGNSKWEQKKKA